MTPITIVVSPFIDTCRILIERGADPETPVIMRHSTSDFEAMYGRLGGVAGAGVRGTRITRAAGRAVAPPMRPIESGVCRGLKSRAA